METRILLPDGSLKNYLIAFWSRTDTFWHTLLHHPFSGRDVNRCLYNSRPLFCRSHLENKNVYYCNKSHSSGNIDDCSNGGNARNSHYTSYNDTRNNNGSNIDAMDSSKSGRNPS